MYHTQVILKNNPIKTLATVIAFSCSLTAANPYQYQETEQRRTARTSVYKKPAPFTTNKPAGRSFLEEFDLFVRVLCSGPFGLYHGWRTRNNKQTRRF